MKILGYFLCFICCSCDLVLVDGSIYSSSRTGSICQSITLRNGVVKRRVRGRMVRFNCNRGYLLAGERHSTCSHGRWDPLPPKCVRPTCKAIGQQPDNDVLLIYPTHSGAVQHFFCKTGYSLKGPTDVYCDGQKWDNNAPICLPSNTKPKLFCDFENVDLCGYTHDLNHDFDWRRENYNTPSGTIGTGPSYDHTKGQSQDGHYMYIESSSRQENDTARLISPVYDEMGGEICLEFFYHMFGGTIGSLRVYMKKANESWDLYPKSAIFSKSGNQGNKWYRGYERLGKINDKFQIIFEGVRGPGYVSDIAIDDVKIITNCTEEDSITTTTEDDIGTEKIPSVDSCDKRCGQKEGLSNDSYHLTCDCDDDCFDDNRCCPDYYDFCGIATTDMTTAAETTTDFIKYPIATNRTSKSLVGLTTIKAITTISTGTRFKTTTQPLASTKSTTKYVATTLPPKTTKLVLHIQTPPTTPEIIRKIVPTSKPLTTILEVIHSKPTTHRPSTKIDNNDVEEVPRPTKSDEGLLLNSPLPDDDGSFSKEYWSDENDNRFDTVPFHRNLSVHDKLLSQGASKTGVNALSIVLTVIGIVVVTSIVVFLAVRRYRWPRRRRIFSNGESQSDVRFLTNDEILDFSLDNE